MARPAEKDRKMKMYINARRSYLEKIDEVSYDMQIKKTDILDLSLKYMLPLIQSLEDSVKGSDISPKDMLDLALRRAIPMFEEIKKKREMLKESGIC